MSISTKKPSFQLPKNLFTSSIRVKTANSIDQKTLFQKPQFQISSRQIHTSQNAIRKPSEIPENNAKKDDFFEKE